jgi:hypothetical protein
MLFGGVQNQQGMMFYGYLQMQDIKREGQSEVVYLYVGRGLDSIQLTVLFATTVLPELSHGS